MVCIGVAPTIKYRVLFAQYCSSSSFPLKGDDPRSRRLDMRNKTNRRSAPFSYFIRTATESQQENPGRIQVVSLLVRIETLGPSVTLAENRIFPGIFTLICSPRGTTDPVIVPFLVPLTLTVLEKKPDAAILFCRLA